MRILLTNDDGIAAPGLHALYRAIRDLGEVVVVAPADVQSAAGHAVTFHKKIVTRPHRAAGSGGEPLFEGVAVEGRPADCVKLAMAHLCPQPVDLCISGMNAGANVGINVIYSGTVAAAMEAAFMGVPSIAVSLHLGDPARTRWDLAAAHARRVLDRILAGTLERHTVLNLNVPILDTGEEPRGLRVVPISTSPIVDTYLCEDEACGDRSFHAAGHLAFHHTPPDSDVEAIFERYITLTPLHFDLTHQGRMSAWRGRLGVPPPAVLPGARPSQAEAAWLEAQ